MRRVGVDELDVAAGLGVDQDAALVAAVAGEAAADQVHVPRHVLHRVGAAVDGDDAAATADVRLQVGELHRVERRRPVDADGRVHHDRLVLLERGQIEERAGRERDARGRLATGARADVRVPDLDVEAVRVAELLDHPLVVDDRLVAEAARTTADQHLVGGVRVRAERDRVVEHAQRLGARVGRADGHAGAARVDGRAVDLGDQRVGRAGQGGFAAGRRLELLQRRDRGRIVAARPARWRAVP